MSVGSAKAIVEFHSVMMNRLLMECICLRWWMMKQLNVVVEEREHFVLQC